MGKKTDVDKRTPLEKLKDIHEKNDRENDKRKDGFLILFDIIDSTERKLKKGGYWNLSTESLYDISNKKFDELNETYKRYKGTEGFSFIKFLGDGIMMFFESKKSDRVSYKPDYSNKKYDDFERMFSMETFRTVKEIERRVFENSKYLENMKLKVVVCYLTNVVPIETNGVKDVIGRGVDFAFRLEKFAGATHHIYNCMFYYLISSKETDKEENFKKECVSLNASRKMKGWDKPQKFYIITDNKFKTSSSINFGDYVKDSPFDNDVRTNLLVYLYKKYEELLENNVNRKDMYLEKLDPEDTFFGNMLDRDDTSNDK